MADAHKRPAQPYRSYADSESSYTSDPEYYSASEPVGRMAPKQAPLHIEAITPPQLELARLPTPSISHQNIQIHNSRHSQSQEPCGSTGIANRIMDVMELQERGRQDAFAKVSMGQERDTTVMSAMVQLMQGAQEMSMRRLSTTNPEAHRILDAPRRRDKQKRRRHRAQETQNAPHDGATDRSKILPLPTEILEAPASLHPGTADVGTSPRAKRSASMPASKTTSKAAPMLPPSMSSSITKPPSMSPPSTPPPPMVVAAAVQRHKNYTESSDIRNDARHPRDRSRNRAPSRDVRPMPIVSLRPGPDASGDTKRDHRKDSGHPASSSRDDRMRAARQSSYDGKGNDKYTQNRRSGGGLRNSGSLDDVIRRDRL
jgi:hypothetical protein